MNIWKIKKNKQPPHGALRNDMTREEKIVEAIKLLKDVNCDFELKFYPDDELDIATAIDTIHKSIDNVECLSSDEEWEYIIIKHEKTN